jgi:hypothetical protein
MLPGGSDPWYRQSLGHGGTWVRKVEVWWDGVMVEGNLPIISGALSANLTNRVTRTVSLQVDSSLWPSTPTSLLSPLGAELRIFCGWRFMGSAPLEWQVFRGPVCSVSFSPGTGVVDVEAADLAEAIVADNFIYPKSSIAGGLTSAKFRDLVNDTFPDAVFRDVYESYATVPVVAWDTDRAGALDGLASASGCFWYTLPDGAFTLTRVPWAASSYGAPVATVDTASGLTDVTVKKSRDGVSNTVVVRGEAANGSTPSVGVATDLNPLSPTRSGGPVGRRVHHVSDNTVGSPSQAQYLAWSVLRRARATVEEWSATMSCDPSLELGDVVTLSSGGLSALVALTGFGMPLTGGQMTSDWRTSGGLSDG